MSRAAQGLRAWLLQRFTAIYLGIYLIAVLILVMSSQPVDYVQWQSWFGNPVMSVLSTLFGLALLMHVWVGVRDVLIDYVHVVWLRLSLMAITGFVLLGSLLWIVRALALATARTAG